MSLSKNSVSILVDLIENRLAAMSVGNREDVRQIVSLRHCLNELNAIEPEYTGSIEEVTRIPRRGRGRKVSDLMEGRTD